MNRINKVRTIITSAFISISIIVLFRIHMIIEKVIPLRNFNDRIVSTATLNGIDIDGKTKIAYLMVILLAILCALLYKVLEKSKKYLSQEYGNILNMIDHISTIGLGCIVYGYLIHSIEPIVIYLAFNMIAVFIILIALKKIDVQLNELVIEASYILSVLV